MIPIYIINLPNEPGRLAIVQQQISGVSGVELSRVEGVSG
jgi:GR25 family glycosyltransferase involved in LPS biosynthesis